MTRIRYIGAVRAHKNVEGETIFLRDVGAMHLEFLKAFKLAEFFPAMRAHIVKAVEDHILERWSPGDIHGRQVRFDEEPMQRRFKDILNEYNVRDPVVLVHVNGSRTVVAARLLDETTLDFGTWCHLFKGHVEIARDYHALNDASRTRVTMHVRSSMFSGVGENQQGAWLAAVDAMKRGETWKP